MSGYKILSHGSLAVMYDLIRLYAETLETRSLRLDLTMIFCIICGIDCVIYCETSRTRGHNYKVPIQRDSNIYCRLNSFVFHNVNADEMTSIL